MSVSIRPDGASLVLKAPYNAIATGELRALGGRWSPTGKTWAVPARYEERLRAILVRCYGTDGESPPDTVTVRVRIGERAAAAIQLAGLPAGEWAKLNNLQRVTILTHLDAEAPLIDVERMERLELFGRGLLSRFGRDQRVTFHDDVALVEGAPLPLTGGSVKNPRLDIARPRVIEVANVPRALALEAVAEHGGAVWVVEPPPATQAPPSLPEAPAAGERAVLLARLSELERELAAVRAQLAQL